jgi:putative phage-type endonuclease
MQDPLTKLQCKVFSTNTGGEIEWLQNRTRGIGGSDIGPICGVSPFTSARQVYLSKTGQYSDAMGVGAAAQERMYFGKILEPVIADEYAKRTQAKLVTVNATLQHHEYPWALASVDRLIVDTDGNPIGVLECKSTSEYMKDEWDAGEILQTYVYQLQWYLWITGLQMGVFACLVGGNKFYIYELPRDDELIHNTLIPAAEQFWNEHVLKLQEPEMQNTDTEFANSLYSTVVPGSELVLADDVANDLLDTIFECKAKIKQLEATMNEAQNRIKDRLQDHEIGISADYTVKWSPRRQSRVDTDKLKANYPDVARECSKTIEFRAMMVRRAKE